MITGISLFAPVPALADDPVQVAANNYVCAESDIQMRGYVESYNNFGTFEHFPKPCDLDNQITVRGDRDTRCSFGVFDLTSLLSFTLPDPKQPNFLHIEPGWNYTVRLYKPRKEILDGSWILQNREGVV